MSISTHAASFAPNTATTNKRPAESPSQHRTSIDRRPLSIASCTDPRAVPRIFTPQCLLPRAQLPLAYLDTAQEGSRLFTAHVQVLEACHDYGEDDSVLIVVEEKDQRLYAIERVQLRKYAMCRLAEQLSIAALLVVNTSYTPADASQSKRRKLRICDGTTPWWTCAAIETHQSVQHCPSNLPRLALKRDALSSSREPDTQTKQVAAQANQRAATEGTAPEDLQTSYASSEQIFEELSKHYLDALYLSRTTLAYFVKGPLARARAALISQPGELITFLRGTMLSSSTLDKKFRDIIRDLIKDMPSMTTPRSLKKSGRKRKWKPKRDKQGLFVDEKEYIERWWRKIDENVQVEAINETNHSLLKRRLQVVRNRETFLQIVVAMEILALEAIVATAPRVAAQDPRHNLEASQSNGFPDKDKKYRKKKEMCAQTNMDTLIERLNIFHTVESSPVKTRDGENGSTSADTRDDLKTFATEVVIPFFASRIFDVANAVSKKLGGPSAPRPLEKKQSTMSRKPGEPTVRQPPEKKPRRPLGRTSTDTLNHVGRQPPALMRSATDKDTFGPLIKREMSESPSLHDIAAADTGKATSKKRMTGLDQYTAKHRQIDLSAMTQANQAKIRKNKELEDKVLRDALNGIRKPNRALATAETARNADESFARALAKSRPPKPQSQRHPALKEAARITATPRHVKATPAPRRQTQSITGMDSTSTAVVPSSAPLQSIALDNRDNCFAVPQTGHRTRQVDVVETPSRGFARFMPSGLARAPGTLLESPTLSRSALGLATPVRPLQMPSLAETPSAKSSPALNERNAQRRDARASSPKTLLQHDDSGIGLESPVMARKSSVYDALGWTDDYDGLA